MCFVNVLCYNVQSGTVCETFRVCGQVVSITESQWSGAVIIIVSPDSDNLSILQVRFHQVADV